MNNVVKIRSICLWNEIWHDQPFKSRSTLVSRDIKYSWALKNLVTPLWEEAGAKAVFYNHLPTVDAIGGYRIVGCLDMVC